MNKVAWNICRERVAAMPTRIVVLACAATLLNWLLLAACSLAIREGFLALSLHDARYFNALALVFAGLLATRAMLQALQDRCLRHHARESMKAVARKLGEVSREASSGSPRSGRHLAASVRAMEQACRISLSMLVAPADLVCLLLTIVGLLMIDLAWGIAAAAMILVAIAAALRPQPFFAGEERSDDVASVDVWRLGTAALLFFAGHRCLAGQLELSWLFVGLVLLSTAGAPLARLLNAYRCFCRFQRELQGWQALA